MTPCKNVYFIKEFPQLYEIRRWLNYFGDVEIFIFLSLNTAFILLIV